MSMVERIYNVTIYMPKTDESPRISTRLTITANSSTKAAMIAHNLFKETHYEYVKVNLDGPYRYVAWDIEDLEQMTEIACSKD